MRIHTLKAAAIIVALLSMVVFVACNGDDTSKSGSGATTANPSVDGPTTPVNTAPTTSAEVPLPEDDDGEVPDSAPTVSGSAPPPAPAPKKIADSKPAPKPKPKPTAAVPKPKPVAKPVPANPAPLPKPTPKPKATAKTPPPPATPEPLAAPAKDSADEVAAKIDAIFGPVKRFRARFNQKYTAKIHNTTKKSKGILYVVKPGKLSLSYQKPNKNRAVSDGTTLKVYEHENKQMFIKNVANTEYPGAFAFILGKGLRNSFTFTFHKKTKWEGGPVIVGTPRVPNPGYKKVLFYIDDSLLATGNLGAVRRVLVVDAQANRNRFDFIHAEQPDKVGAKEFNFEPPKGTEIIKG